MPTKVHVLSFEQGDKSPQKSNLSISESPSRTPTKILSHFTDSPHEALIECQRMKMIVKQQKTQLERLTQKQTQDQAEIERLRSQLQSEKSATYAQIIELEDKVSDLLACNRQLRAEIARGGSPESSVQLSPSPAKKSILPSRWTRSQPNLKQPAKISSLAPIMSSVSSDSIDLLESQVSDLAVESLVKAMEVRPRALDLKPSELLISPTISLNSPVSTDKPQPHLLKELLQPQPPQSPTILFSKCTPRKSRFTEDFSFEDESANIQNLDKSSRWSDPGVIDFSVKNPVPKFESTFIGDRNEFSNGETNEQVIQGSEEADLVRLPRDTNGPPKRSEAKGVKTLSKTSKETVKALEPHLNTKLPPQVNPSPSAQSPASPSKPIYKMISQVFLGEVLHKSARGFRKTEQHERYFWIHPYSLTLYWDKENPSAGGGPHQPKSAPIMGVSEEIDMNMIPGLYHKSIVIHSGKRNIKVTCSSPTRHDVWMKSLRYLLAGAGK